MEQESRGNTPNGYEPSPPASAAPAPAVGQRGSVVMIPEDTHMDTPTPMRPDNQLGELSGLHTPLSRRSAPTTPRVEAPSGRQPLRPQPGCLHLSEVAIDQRARRLLTPKANGQKKLSEDVIAMYKAGGKSRKDFFNMFQACGFDPDWL